MLDTQKYSQNSLQRRMLYLYDLQCRRETLGFPPYQRLEQTVGWLSKFEMAAERKGK